MHRSFELLSVSDERELRDPARLRRLARRHNLGLAAAAVGGGAAGILSAALSGYAVIGWLAGELPASAGLTNLVFGLVLTVSCLAMAFAFGREVLRHPLRLCLKEPQNYEFVRGSLVSASYLSSGGRASRRMLVKGMCPDGDMFMEEFEPGLWSDAVAERGEESLKPGDDRYDQKGRRARLPIEVWVVRRAGVRGSGALAGIPAETAARLMRRR